MNLNPFDLRGPDFLIFYACLLGATALVLLVLRQVLDRQNHFAVEERFLEVARDPYQIAFLRGGATEVLRTAVVSLLERDLIGADGDRYFALDEAGVAKVRRPLDKAILTRLGPPPQGNKGGADSDSLLTDPVILQEAEQVGEPLAAAELVPGPATRRTRWLLIVLATAALWFVAGTKIAIALSRGRTNVGFLVVLALAAPFILRLTLWSRLTACGRAVRDRTVTHFAELLSRSDSFKPGQTTSELAFLAAAYGTALLPVAMRARLAPLDQAVIRHAQTSNSDSGGSSCSSSSSCSGGGSCGGGGCGGCGS
jgi:uncharacterized protein (TIGR04222 family)